MWSEIIFTGAAVYIALQYKTKVSHTNYHLDSLLNPIEPSHHQSEEEKLMGENRIHYSDYGNFWENVNRFFDRTTPDYTRPPPFQWSESIYVGDYKFYDSVNRNL